MRFYKAIIVLLSVCGFSWLCSCDKSSSSYQNGPDPGNNSLPIYGVDTALLAHYNYKPGSFWVYKDSLTGRVDSFFVSNYDSIAIGGTGTGYYRVYINITLQEINKDFTALQDSATWMLTLTGSDASLAYYRDTTGTRVLECAYHLLTSPLGSSISPSIGDTVALATTYSSYVFNGYFFSNIYVFHHYNNTDPALQNSITYIQDDLWLCNGGGLVKMRLNHPLTGVKHVWELRNHQLVL